ncbi:MAG: hypothetical protein ACK40M_11300 [Flavobacteriales bacterium]
MNKKTKKRILIVLVAIAAIAIPLVIWMKQPAEITKQDEETAAEIAIDPGVLDAIDAGINGQDNNENSSQEDTIKP